MFFEKLDLFKKVFLLIYLKFSAMNIYLPWFNLPYFIENCPK